MSLFRNFRILPAASALLFAACSSEKPDAEQPPAPPSVKPASSDANLGLLTARPIGEGFEGFPWVTDLTIVDLDQDGLLDVVFCEGRLHEVVWLRQSDPGVFDERLISNQVQGPAHVESGDMDQDGDLDLLISGMGIVTPSQEQIGTVVILENDGEQRFVAREILSKVPRVTYVAPGDLDGDGDLDLSVGMFGYFEGETRWLENQGNGEFGSHQLLALEGTVHAPIVDLDGDGDNDIVSLVSQDWEEVYGFFNDGSGNFESRVLWGSTNKDYGSSGLSVADLDRDGDIDIVFTNGDGFDYATPGSRPWHGVQWLENDGSGKFAFHRIGALSGSYSPFVTDVNEDGYLDVVVASGFNDWNDPQAVSLAFFENDGKMNFTKQPLAYSPTHLVVIDGADLNRDGHVELVTGAFHFYPPYERLSRVTLWQRANK